MLGLDTGDRWEALHELSRQRIRDDELVFTSLHYLMAPSVLGDTETVDLALAHYQDWSRGQGDQHQVSQSVGEIMANAIAHIGRGEHQAGAALLRSVEHNIHQIGGSHAQRALFSQLIEHYQ